MKGTISAAILAAVFFFTFDNHFVQAGTAEEWDDDLTGNWRFSIAATDRKISGWLTISTHENPEWTDIHSVQNSALLQRGVETGGLLGGAKQWSYENGVLKGRLWAIPDGYDFLFEVVMGNSRRSMTGFIRRNGSDNLYDFTLEKNVPNLKGVRVWHRVEFEDRWTEEPYSRSQLVERDWIPAPRVTLEIIGDGFAPGNSEFYVKTDDKDFYQRTEIADYSAQGKRGDNHRSERLLIELDLRPSIESGEKWVWVNGQKINFEFYFAEDEVAQAEPAAPQTPTISSPPPGPAGGNIAAQQVPEKKPDWWNDDFDSWPPPRPEGLEGEWPLPDSDKRWDDPEFWADYYRNKDPRRKKDDPDNPTGHPDPNRENRVTGSAGAAHADILKDDILKKRDGSCGMFLLNTFASGQNYPPRPASCSPFPKAHFKALCDHARSEEVATAECQKICTDLGCPYQRLVTPELSVNWFCHGRPPASGCSAYFICDCTEY